MSNIKFAGRPVYNPILQLFAVFFVFTVVLVLFPLWLPADPILKALGLRGFLRPHGQGYSICLDSDAFRRRG